jgi:hypothetical protein
VTKIKLFRIAVMTAAAVGLVLAAQRQDQNKHEQVRLRQDNLALREQLAHLQEPAPQPVGPQVDAAELERLRQGEGELLRLRGEVSRLRQELQAASTPSTTAKVAIKARLLAEASQAAEAHRAEMELQLQRFMDDVSQKFAARHAQDLRQLADAMVATNPMAAIEFAKELKPDDIRPFLDSVFASWAANDTEAALNWVDQQVSDPGEKEADIQAIQSAAPVGIGVELAQHDDYTVINRILPGSPAESSGQIQPGDRILAVAQGDDAFVDARSFSLADLVQAIRGAPGTPIQLQIIPTDASLDSQPQTVTLYRDQIKFKR